MLNKLVRIRQDAVGSYLKALTQYMAMSGHYLWVPVVSVSIVYGTLNDASYQYMYLTPDQLYPHILYRVMVGLAPVTSHIFGWEPLQISYLST